MRSEDRKTSDLAPTSEEQGASGNQPHVVMIVANDVTVDTRVMKMAHDVAEAGPRVTVLGISSTGNREQLALGKARIVLLPVTDLLRTTRARWFGPVNRHLITRKMQVERDRYFNFQREVGASIGWLRADYFKGRSERMLEANRRESKRQDKLRMRQEGNQARARATQVFRWRGPARMAEAYLRFSVRSQTAIARRLRRTRNNYMARRERAREAAFRRSERDIQRRLEGKFRRFTRLQDRHRARLIRDARAEGNAGWRQALPELHDFEVAFGPELDRLRPNVIHAQDVHLLGVGARAASRGQVAGAGTRLIYDSHEYIQGLGTYSGRIVAAWSALEREYIRRADRVITVSPTIAEMLAADYDLEPEPQVVMNIPIVVGGGGASVRDAAGVGEDVTLLVYSGGLDPTRGVHTLVKALGRLHDAHLALVSKVDHGYVRELREIAREGGYEDRLHIVPFVPPQQVATYLSSATVGVQTIVAGPINHEVTMPNKLFEYMHARLPIVISNCRVMSEFVKGLEIGEAFVSEDVDSLAETISVVLGNLEKYHAAYDRQPEMLERYSWRTERRKLFEVYRDLLGNDALPEDIESLGLASLADVKG